MFHTLSTQKPKKEKLILEKKEKKTNKNLELFSEGCINPNFYVYNFKHPTSSSSSDSIVEGETFWDRRDTQQ